MPDLLVSEEELMSTYFGPDSLVKRSYANEIRLRAVAAKVLEAAADDARCRADADSLRAHAARYREGK